MNERKLSSQEQEAISAEPENVEPDSGEMTEDELDEAVGGVGSVDEQSPESSGGSGRGWWLDPNG